MSANEFGDPHSHQGHSGSRRGHDGSARGQSYGTRARSLERQLDNDGSGRNYYPNERRYTTFLWSCDTMKMKQFLPLELLFSNRETKANVVKGNMVNFFVFGCVLFSLGYVIKKNGSELVRLIFGLIGF